MAYGLLYNLNFSSNIEGNRKHRISIYKDGHTATITTDDNNLIGTSEPAILIWDNTDDIYNNIMASRLEMNFYSDDTKQADILDILDNTDPSKFKVEFYMEDELGSLTLYWVGYLSNANYEERISSEPVPYQLIATDLLGTLKNILSTDGSAIIDSKPTVMKYLDNVLAFLPQNYQFRISNDIQIKPILGSFTKMHLVPWLFPFKNGFELFADTADEYIKNILKLLNARLFYANNSWYIINNSTYKDTAPYDLFDTSGDYSSSYNFSSVKTIPTDYTPILNDMSIRYDTPIDTVEITADRNEYTTDFDDIVLTSGGISNLSPFPSFETKVNGILFNSTFYSDDFNTIQDQPVVKRGNYAIKTRNIISSGNPTQKILDTGFIGEFQPNPQLPITFYTSYYIQNSLFTDQNFRLFYSLVRETSANQSGSPVTREYWHNGWSTYTNESSIHKLEAHNSTAPTSQWVEFKESIEVGTTQAYARYRVILWQPRVDTADSLDLILNFDEVFIGRYNTIQSLGAVKTVVKVSGSQRKNKKKSIDFQHFYPVQYFGTEFQTDDISISGLPGSVELNMILSQQILNDNRTHIKRYSTSVYVNDFSEFLYPYHKIEIDMTGFETDNSGIIDRLEYRAKSGIYKIEFHETNQGSAVNTSYKILAKENPFVIFDRVD